MTFDVAMTLPTGLPRFPGAFTRGVAILTACQSAFVFRVHPQGGEPVESRPEEIPHDSWPHNAPQNRPKIRVFGKCWYANKSSMVR
jgi:hypothetical protein